MKVFARRRLASPLIENAMLGLRRFSHLAKHYCDIRGTGAFRSRPTQMFRPADGNNADEIDLFVVTSVVNARKRSIYTHDQRLDQLLDLTIRTIREKVPFCYIIVLEGSKLTSEQVSKIRRSGVDELYFLDVNGRNKSKGELALISSYFNSKFFKDMARTKRIRTINKLSGRYYLGDDYSFDSLDQNLCVIKRIDTGTWSGYGYCATRYYKFPFSYVGEYIRKIDDLRKSGVFIDVEHSFYKNEIIPFDQLQQLDQLHIKGSLAPNGTEIVE